MLLSTRQSVKMSNLFAPDLPNDNSTLEHIMLQIKKKFSHHLRNIPKCINRNKTNVFFFILKKNTNVFHFGIQEINKHILSSAAVLSSIQIKPTFLQLSSFSKLFCVLDFLIVSMNFRWFFFFRFYSSKEKAWTFDEMARNY